MPKITLRKKKGKKEEIDSTMAVEIKDVDIKEKPKTKSKRVSDVKSKIRFFDNIAKYSMYVLIGLLPVFFLPTSFIELGQAKLGLLITAVTVAVVSMGLSIIYGGSIKIVNKKIWIPALLISIITLISAFFSTSYSGSIMGNGSEIDSWYLISILLLTTILISSVINTKERIFSALSIFWSGLGVASVFQILRLISSAFKIDLFTSILSLGGRFDLPVLNMIGSWGDLGIATGVGALSLAITLDMVPLKDSIKKIYWVIFSVSTFVSFVASSIVVGSGIDQLNNGSQFVVPSMTVVGIVALLFAVFRLVQSRKEKEDKIKSVNFPVANVILIVLGIIVMASPLALNQGINQFTGVPNESVLNVRPGVSDTYIVSKEVLNSSIKNSLIGVGPHGFYIAWNTFRPDYINKTDLWNTDFQFGVGYLPTLLINNGVLVFILLIVSLLLLLVAGIKSILINKKDSAHTYTSIVTLLSAIFLWINAILNVPGSMVLILTFIVTGFLLANIIVDNKLTAKEFLFDGSNVSLSAGSNDGSATDSTAGYDLKKKHSSKRVFSMVTIILVMILTACLALVWINRIRSQFYSAESTQLIYAKSANISIVPQAIFSLQKAFDIYPNDLYARGINNLAIVQINYDISSSPENQNMDALKNGQALAMSSSTEAYIEVAASSGKESVYKNRNDFRNYLQFGSTMQTIALLNLEKDAGGYALQSFAQAIKLAPKHPLPLYSLANLYVLAGDRGTAKTLLEQALKLKPNFNEASDLYQGILTDEAKARIGAEDNSSATSTTKKK